MRTVEDYERIRKAYYVERLSMREICRQFHHGRNVIRKALERAEPEAYRLKEPRPAPVLAAYKPKIDVLIMESEQLPRKQRYTGRKIYQLAVAEHPRCLGREQDILDPLHYLGLLEQRPGAFEYAIPMRRWRKDWPANYARLLASLRQNKPDGDGIREFITILKLHRRYPAEIVNRAVQQALEIGILHLDGVQLCLRQLVSSETQALNLELTHPNLAEVGNQPVRLDQYPTRLLAWRKVYRFLGYRQGRKCKGQKDRSSCPAV